MSADLSDLMVPYLGAGLSHLLAEDLTGALAEASFAAQQTRRQYLASMEAVLVAVQAQADAVRQDIKRDALHDEDGTVEADGHA